MKTFTTFKELHEVIKNRRIYLWTSIGFVEVTKKSLLYTAHYLSKICGSYEHNTSYTVLLSF